ncbi:recombinase family protein [Kitasatospora viridis]|uniref:Resolvase-like protein n=1 Tax=Kitasatospora viridis TaxID=281105 RepID=A0A561TSJ8_9ACTN|nr:recombinase family protein [Kitasatospora viridis]TWF90082.1 resolvase-like protein [Kitasatospora viridis]
MDAAAPAIRPTTGPVDPALPPAAYLRCPIGATRARRDQREALEHFAARLGLPAPDFYEDLTASGAEPPHDRPRFQALTRAVQDGSHRLLLVPGPSVLGDCEDRVRDALRRLTSAGCGRILALPAPGQLVRVGRGRRNAGPAYSPARARRLG